MFFKNRKVSEITEAEIKQYESYEVLGSENNGSHWGWWICWLLLFWPFCFILLIMYFARPIKLVKLSKEVHKVSGEVYVKPESKVIWVNESKYEFIVSNLNNNLNNSDKK